MPFNPYDPQGIINQINNATTVANLVANDPNTWVYNGDAGAVDIVHENGIAYATGPEYAGQPSVTVQVAGAGGGVQTVSETTYTTVNTTQQVAQSRTGTQTETIAVQTGTTVNNSIVDTTISPYIRSRRLKIVGRHFKPTTQLYPFFDGVNVSAFCRPYSDPTITPSLALSAGPDWVNNQAMTWGGDYDPQTNQNDGTTADTGDTGTSASYDVGSLNDPIMTDSLGTCTLFFEIPCTDANKFKTGVRTFRLTDNITNSATADTFGDTDYTSAGIIQQNQETITAIYSPQVEVRQASDNQVITQNLGSTTTASTSTYQVDVPAPPVDVTLWVDPVAQSFLVKSNGGMFVTKVDVYFQTADSSVPITMQIRSMINGYPSQEVVPFSTKVLYPNNPTLSAMDSTGTIPTNGPSYSAQVINTSDDASVPTSFYFDAPVYLNDGTEYAIVLIANSVNYFLYTAKLGGVVVGSTNIVSSPPYLGNLFKSQNASTWVADPSQNLKFTVWSAVFDTTLVGEAVFTSSTVQADTLLSLPFQTINGSNIVRVYHANHMMPKGQYVNSLVTISNVAAGTYNGLTDTQLNGTFSIDNVDLNSYTITVPGSPALATSRVGPDGVSATRNQQFDAICPVVNALTTSGTSINWDAKFTSGKSPNNNSSTTQEPYAKDSTWTTLPVNTTTLFTAPRMLASDINETTSIVGASAFDRKSMVLRATLATSQINLTPILDTTRVSAIVVNNLIDDPTFASYTNSTMDQGVTVTSTSMDSLSFNSQVLVSVVAVTGGNYIVTETVTGSASGATGVVVSWDSVTLTLSGVNGVFQVTEAISGASAIGTVQSFQYVNTITNPSSVLDFTVFKPGYSMTINGCPSNQYPYDNPVAILDVTGNVITVDTHGSPFAVATGQSNVQLTQYVRFVSETGPSGCTAASRYITRQFNLAAPANSLHILFNINRPPGSFVDVYYRILKANSTQAFNSIVWVPLGVDAATDSTESTNPTLFKEYSYTAKALGAFTAFSVKIVMRGGNSSQVPLIQAFRAIATAT